LTFFDIIWPKEIPMAQMNISLPDQMKEWIDAQVATGRYASVSDYMRALVRHHMETEEKRTKLSAMIQAGIDSGISDRSIDDIKASAMERIRHEQLSARVGGR
jgi:antitoxin ParD1/3/4